MPDLSLDADSVARTVALLRRRIDERFPDSGLGRVCRELDRITGQTRERAAWIATPILGLRVGVGALLALIAAGLAGTVLSLHRPNQPLEVFQFVQLLESGINDVVLVGAGVFFLVTLETRIKRRRALAAIRELRAIAHIIDMHQLTKDPEWIVTPGVSQPGIRICRLRRRHIRASAMIRAPGICWSDLPVGDSSCAARPGTSMGSRRNPGTPS